VVKIKRRGRITVKKDKVLAVAAELKKLEKRSEEITKRLCSIDAERSLLTEERYEVANGIIKTQTLVLQTALDQV
jgi:hypothetical protein